MNPTRSLGDFSVDGKRFMLLCACALPIGALAGLLAKVLLLAIGAITHLAYGLGPGTSLVAPDPHHLGPLAILIPVVGGLIVGAIARYGTEAIRGHGIPEAIGSILNRDSVIPARVAFFKPIASAVAIGTGGPFGAEGPIIMTGGAFGSLFAQFLRLTSAERRVLLVAGASAGMAATFGAPIASVLIAVELLLFEWRPRSFVPVVVAVFAAMLVREALIGEMPPFVTAGALRLPSFAIAAAVALGLMGGAVSMLMTKLVYWTEDAYHRLPIPWVWWPALGGLIVGIGGWFVPQALGVGYPTIAGMANGHVLLGAAVGIAIVKIVIWIASLSSGTSGGVLAPLLMIGAAVGTLFAAVVPGHATAAWAIVGMAALMGGTMRAPFMATLFALETTRAWGLAPEVFVGCVAATTFTVLFVPRSILTERLARLGMHVAREYSVHPLELIAVEQVMLPVDGSVRPAESVAVGDRVRRAADAMAERHQERLAVVDASGHWVGVLGPEQLLAAWRLGMHTETRRRRVRSLRRITHRRPTR